MTEHHADVTTFSSKSRAEVYESALESGKALFAEESFWPANLANAASLMWYAFDAIGKQVNWAGFYVTMASQGSDLLLGPFMGRVACQRIMFGKGVCGTAASTQEVQLVPNVDQFPGHIACDGETKSEIVVPMVDQTGVLRGVLDVDCLVLSGLDEIDATFLKQLADLLVSSCKW
ncbi:GAF domain-like protein [Lipomyces oligophaga]|uniref:GAF domain-like protein n=1 Tax=Lipomyces oligophaga TaxID=45792 RepID=UPI0034CEA5B6